MSIVIPSPKHRWKEKSRHIWNSLEIISERWDYT